MNEPNLYATDYLTRNRDCLAKSKVAVCLHCRRCFRPDTIEEWTDRGQTAICPVCMVDAVLGDACGLPILSEAWVEQQHQALFGKAISLEQLLDAAKAGRIDLDEPGSAKVSPPAVVDPGAS